MKISILGTGCPKCRKLAEAAEGAAKELGIPYDLEKVTDINAIMGCGVMMTPALAIDGAVVATGKALSVEEAKTLLSKHNSGETHGRDARGGIYAECHRCMVPTLRPMRPKPIMPRVLPPNSTPIKSAKGKLPPSRSA